MIIKLSLKFHDKKFILGSFKHIFLPKDQDE